MLDGFRFGQVRSHVFSKLPQQLRTARGWNTAEVQMRNAFCSVLMIGIAILPDSASAKTSTFAYVESGTCLASPEGFNSKLEPVNSGVAWTTTFNAAGTADANGNVTELGQSVDSAAFGVGPRMHMPAAHAYEDTFSFTVTEPDGDGNVTLHVGSAQWNLYCRAKFLLAFFR